MKHHLHPTREHAALACIRIDDHAHTCIDSNCILLPSLSVFNSRTDQIQLNTPIAIMPDSRWTRVGRHSYNTNSHSARPIRTPGGKLVAQRDKKTSKGPRCGDSKVPLQGIKHIRSTKYHSLKKRQRTVSRAYGGCLSAKCVKERIMRAFLLEEQKAVKKVLAERKK
uniref:60S ribosomal protein L34 n=1 Tax=Craspedostauros australis TaxID=1486917 RepID=A0A7R9ZJZ0_9STRA|mmetsp:Transcript_12185/g.33542  ORF Transcript_12185/g.33542 Transcript_12185/m.33542 type:complete len:167 (+) Transcript_12185:309-809(+)